MAAGIRGEVVSGERRPNAPHISILERGGILQSEAGHSIHANVHGPDSEHRKPVGATAEDPTTRSCERNREGMDYVRADRSSPGAEQIPEHGKVWRKYQKTEQEP